MKIFDDIRDALQDKEVKIVLPEGEEPRILQATKRLVKETNITPVYDKQEDIYPALITMIDDGVTALRAGTETIKVNIAGRSRRDVRKIAVLHAFNLVRKTLLNS